MDLKLKQNQPIAPEKKCPSCGAIMTEDAVLCVKCGHDLRTGQRMGARSPARSSRRFGAGIAAAVLLLACCLGYWRMGRPAPPPAIPPPAPMAREVGGGGEEPLAIPENRPRGFFEGDGVDLLALVCGRDRFDASVDAEALRALARARIELSTEKKFGKFDDLAAFLSPYGVATKPAAMSPGLRVSYMATPAMFAYFNSLKLLGNGETQGALDALAASGLAGTFFNERCQALSSMVRAIASRETALAAAERRTREFIQMIKDRRTRSSISESAVKTALSKKQAEENLVSAKDALDRSMKELPKIQEQVEQMDVLLRDTNPAIVRAFEDSVQAGFVGEGVWLYDRIVNDFLRAQGIRAALRDADLWSEYQPESLPPAAEALRKRVQRLRNMAEEYSQNGAARLEGSPEEAARLFALAAMSDAGHPLARIGEGLCDLRRCVQSAGSVFADPGEAERGARVERLQSELLGARKTGLLRALRRATGRPGVMEATAYAKIGAAIHLTVGAGTDRESSPVVLRLGAAGQKVRSGAGAAGAYWQSVSSSDAPVESEYQALPVIVNDRKDADVWFQKCMIDVFKWWKSVDASVGGGERGVIVAASGDAVIPADYPLVALAAAGYSALKGVPVRQDVAVCGAFRPDASIGAVGQVAERVARAGRLDAIETVIVPDANEPDLALLPAEVLCRVVIIGGRDMAACVRYALDQPEGGATSLLKEEDLKDVPSLADKLRKAEDPVSQYVRTHLSAATVQAIDQTRTDALGSSLSRVGLNKSLVQLKAPLVKDLNDLILNGGDFFVETRFAAVRLTSGTRKLIDKRPSATRTVRLNRSLLDEAYPDAIVAGGKTAAPDDFVEMTQDAQILILMGRAGEAKGILENVKRQAPEIYNAGRLLGLMATYGR